MSDARRLKSLEDENRRLKKLLAESMLDVATLEGKEALRGLGDRRDVLLAAARLRSGRA